MFRTVDIQDGAPRRFRLLVGLIAPMLLLATSCSEVNNVIVEVGTAVLIVNDPDLAPQDTINAESRIQVAEWAFEAVDLILEGDSTPRSLKFDEDCEFIHTAISLPVSRDKCASGIVLGVGDGSPVGAELRLRFSMTMRRGKPKVLDPFEDEDGDEIPNAADKCPLVTDNNEDVNQNGFFDACELKDSAGNLAGVPDSDGDRVADGVDNCLWDNNPFQEDTTGPGADGIRDGIGDACTEQVATVRNLAGLELIEVTLDAGDITDLDTRISILGVDFHSSESITCDWDALEPECRLDTTKIKACVTTQSTGEVRCV